MECRYRHLMLNVVSLMPHCKKDNKVESKESKGATLNELVELKSCSSCLFFEVKFLTSFCAFSLEQDQVLEIVFSTNEVSVGFSQLVSSLLLLLLFLLMLYLFFFQFQCRKQKDLYLWMAKCPNGPSVKFLVNAGNFNFGYLIVDNCYYKLLLGFYLEVQWLPFSYSFSYDCRLIHLFIVCIYALNSFL